MAKAQTPPAETPPSPPQLTGVEADIQNLRSRTGTLEGELTAKFGALETRVATLEQIVEKLERQRAELDVLGKEIRSMIVSRGREVGHDEAVEILEADPSRRFTVMAAYPILGLRPGDAIDPRQRFEHPARDLPHHIRSGLRVAPAPAA